VSIGWRVIWKIETERAVSPRSNLANAASAMNPDRTAKRNQRYTREDIGESVHFDGLCHECRKAEPCFS